MTAGVSAVLGLLGGAVSGDIVARRQFRRQQRAEAEAKLADWTFRPLSTATAELHNTGDEAGRNVQLEWGPHAGGRLHADTIDVIDPGEFRRVDAGPTTSDRVVTVRWQRPDGTACFCTREIPRR
ncbi:hypothetical protein [Microlunatus antarcticus]|uniref:hypothetical protein n=1 Tax=Microlunatus antarcticus TaxID=53388 RepID=UPI001618E407|nr:hypothetical protein [Microlunatus antarcticus]